MIAKLLELLPPRHQDRQGQSIRYCVDVGAWDGQHLSNTYSLLVDDQQQSQCSAATGAGTAFRGVLVEADPIRFVKLEELHRPLGNTCVNVAVSCTEGSKNSLSAIISTHAPDLPKTFDFLCIDVDGTDYWLMVDVLDGGFRPSIMCIEFNPTMPDNIIYIQPRDDGVRHGSSLAALVELAESRNYVLVETTLFNAFFVPRELYDSYLRQEVPDTTIEALHEITMGTALYQLYDGTIKLSGCKKMLWHRIPIKEEKIQILSRDERSFPFAPSEIKCVSDGMDANEWKNVAVDMSSYCQSPGGAGDNNREACAAQLLQQLKSDGFALIRGTGISAATCSKALRATNAFLHEADENVRRSCLTKDRARRGYAPMGTENFASLIGERGNNDLVKKYRIGAESDEEDASCLLRPNVWPSGEVWSKEAAHFFQQSIEQYFDKQCQVTKAVVKAICDGLIESDGMPELRESLKVLSEDHGEARQDTSILTLLNYKRGKRHQKSKKAQALVAPHTDVGVITCLLFDKGDCAVLQRAESTAIAHEMGADRKWIDVKLPPKVPDDPLFVVNIGDCFSELCGGVIPSTIHRVMPRNDGTVARNCLALFYGLDPGDSITLPSGEQMTYEEWRKTRIARAAKILKENSC